MDRRIGLGRFGIGGGGPVYGWVPLAWGEPYRPWWGRCSYGCWDRYNRPYAVNVAVWRPNSPPPREYRNWNNPGGITAVSSNAFATRQPVQQNLVRVPREHDRDRARDVGRAVGAYRGEPRRGATAGERAAAGIDVRAPGAVRYSNRSSFNRGAPVDSSMNRGRATSPPTGAFRGESRLARRVAVHAAEPGFAAPPSQAPVCAQCACERARSTAIGHAPTADAADAVAAAAGVAATIASCSRSKATRCAAARHRRLRHGHRPASAVADATAAA